MSLSNKTHYALLGVGNDADTETIDQAYRHLQQEYSRLSDGKELQTRLQLLAEAHACLTNPLRRRIYDNTLADREPVATVAGQPANRPLPLKPIAIGLAALLLIGAGWSLRPRHDSAATQSGQQTQDSVYGKTLLKSYKLPDEAIAGYNEALAKRGQPGKDSLFALSKDWQGEEFTPAADSNPYRMVIKVNGKALANGTVSTRWQPMWNNRGALMGSLTLKDAKAGDPVKLEGVSPPVSFKSLQPTVPVLEFMDASNIQISGVTVEVWSGLGKNTWFENMYAWSALLVPLIFLGLKLWGRRR